MKLPRALRLWPPVDKRDHINLPPYAAPSLQLVRKEQSGKYRGLASAVGLYNDTRLSHTFTTLFVVDLN